jgi:transposase
MAYRDRELGHLLHVEPKRVAALLLRALRASRNEPGRATERVARELGVSASSIKRWLRALEARGIDVGAFAGVGPGRPRRAA